MTLRSTSVSLRLSAPGARAPRSAARARVALAVLVLGAGSATAAEVPFTKHVISASFENARTVSAGDVDGDGDLDVLAAADSDPGFSWWLNDDGEGGAWVQRVVTPLVTASLHHADIDGDGDLDTLSVPEAQGTVVWHENTVGDGSAWTGRLVASAPFTQNIAFAADLDGDGDLDVVGGHIDANVNNFSVVWWENLDGEGTSWEEHFLVGGNPLCAKAADLDGDGDLDIYRATPQVPWLENLAGDGSTWAPHATGVNGALESTTAVDIDGDGDLDFLTNPGTWWENVTGDGTTWTSHTITPSFGGGARWVHSADLDGDGDLDVLGTSFGADRVAWWENASGDGITWTEHPIDDAFDGASSVAAADVDGDGDLDVVATASHADTIAWWENETIHRSALYPQQQAIDTPVVDANALEAGDLDGDGDLDVVGVATGASTVAWWQNDGDGTGWSEHSIDAGFVGALSAFPADVDGDGDADVLGASSVEGVAWWDNTAGDGTGWTENAISTDAASVILAGDVDGDGDLDAIAASESLGAVTWWENTAGDGTAWATHPIDSDFDGVAAIAVADLDRDGDLDVLGAAAMANDVTWWENTAGDGTAWTEHLIDGDVAGARAVRAADVDGDGDLDVVAAATDDNAIAWWENTAGDGTAWAEHPIDAAFAAWSIAARDLDGDGDVDVLGGTLSDTGAVAWWENTSGDGTSWSQHLVDEAFEAAAVAVADLDRDGHLDLLGAEIETSTIGWWPNRGGQFALPTTDVAPAFGVEGVAAAALAIDLVHRGRAGDHPIELATLGLRLEDGTGMPLSDGEADALLAELAIYLDDGSGAFEAGTDTVVTAVTSFVLTAGEFTIAFADGDPLVGIAHGTSKRFFVVLIFEIGAAGASPNAIRVTNLTESSSAEDADADLPLVLEHLADTSSSVIALDTVAPEVVSISTASGATVTECGALRETSASLAVTFSEPMADPPGNSDPTDVTNPVNYLLVATGPDGDFSTVGCADGPAGDDFPVVVDQVVWDGLSEASLELAPPGFEVELYQLFVCGTLADTTGNLLGDGAGLRFRADPGNAFDHAHFDHCGAPPATLGGWAVSVTPRSFADAEGDDSGGSPLSAAAALTGLAIGAGPVEITLSQCVDLLAGAGYQYSARVRQGPSGATVDATGFCFSFAEPSCTGSVLGASFVADTLTGTGGSFATLAGVMAAPEGAASGLCGFDVASDGEPFFEVTVDRLTLVAVSTPLFADGFESGDTSAWSQAVP